MDNEPAQLLEFQDPLIGRILSQRYRVLRLIGRGGMGVVYLAEHILIQRKLAIKVLQSPLAASEELVMRLHREARAAAAVGNEHVVDVTDMGRLDDGTCYIVLEYLAGLNLADLVAEQKPLAMTRVLDIGLQICDALTAVHEAGIVHRDLKPENIVLTQRGRRADFVKVLDFGICKVFSEGPLTATGVALGTPEFMAPEQLEARPEVDARADIYALGSILFFALSGHAPFAAGSLPQLLMRIWSDPPPKLRLVRPDAPESLERLIERALAKKPNERFATAQSLAAELERIRESVDTEDPSWTTASGVRENPLKAEAAPPPAVDSLLAVPQVHRARRRAGSFAILGLCIAVLLGWIAALASSVLTSGPAERRSRRPEATTEPDPTSKNASPAESRVQSIPAPLATAPAPTASPTAATPELPPSSHDATRRRKPKQPPKVPEASASEPIEVPASPVEQPNPVPVMNDTAEKAPPRPEPTLVPEPRQLKPIF